MNYPPLLSRLADLIDRIRSSLWFVPTIMLAAAIGLGVVSVRVDRLFGESVWDHLPWIGDMSASGAQLILSTIGGSMVTITGIVFPMTVVTLTLASSQFGSRLIRTFMRSKVTQFVLGTFVSTFVYCLVILCVTDNREEIDFVPRLSVGIGLLLAALSMGVLLFFIHHVAASMHASNIVAAVAKEFGDQIEKLFPDALGSSDISKERDRELADAMRAELDSRDVRIIRAAADGYVRFIDESTLLELCADQDFRIAMGMPVGAFIIKGTPILTVAGEPRIDDELEEKMRGCVVIGDQRTAVQDIEFLVDQLVEVALRALSPGINDPRTAISCVHRLGQALGHLVGREMGPECILDEDGNPRILVHVSPFAHLVELGFDRIHDAASGHRHVLAEITSTLGQVADITADSSREKTLREAIDRYGPAADDANSNASDHGRVPRRSEA